MVDRVGKEGDKVQETGCNENARRKIKEKEGKCRFKTFRRKYRDISKKCYISIPAFNHLSHKEKIVSLTTLLTKRNLNVKLFK